MRMNIWSLPEWINQEYFSSSASFGIYDVGFNQASNSVLYV